jgi:hypothetical protein
MAHKSTILAAVAVFGCILVLNSNPITAAAPVTCSPVPGAPTEPVAKPPAAPTGVRIITGLASAILREFFDVVQARGTHPYFEALAARSDCRTAYGLRSQAEIDMLPTSAVSEARKPILYDSAMDAAKLSIYAPVSSDSQQKTVPLQVTNGTLLLTWDFKFDQHFAWVEEGNLGKHKTWRLDPGPWLAIKTDYRQGAHAGRLAEMYVTVPGRKFVGPGSDRDGETLLPRLGQFYFDANKWVRVWVYIEGLGQSVWYVSVWVADQDRNPVKLYDKNAMYPTDNGLTNFRIEYDTSAGPTTNPNEMHSWNRNVVALHNISPSAVPSLLQKPTP